MPSTNSLIAVGWSPFGSYSDLITKRTPPSDFSGRGGRCGVQIRTWPSPRLSAGLSSSASAGPIGCTSGRDALEFGALDLGVLAGFLGVPGFFAMPGIWGESGGEKRANGRRKGALLTRFGCQ